MRTLSIVVSIFFSMAILCSNVIGQSSCITSFGAIYGSPDINEEGHCIVPAQGNDGVYVAGSKRDSVLLMHLNNIGKVVWSRTFDIIPGEPDIVYSLILDSEGMLACTGNSGQTLIACSVFAFRYNPVSHQMLWTIEYESVQPRNFGQGIIQLGSGGNYLMASNPTKPPPFENDLELNEINKNNGSIVPGVFSKNYHYGGSENLGDMIYAGNFIYGSGRYTDGLPNTKMRNTLVKIDPATGTHVWAKLGHVPGNASARLYGADLLIDQNEIYSIYHGDPVSNTATNTLMYIQKSSIDGNLIWLNQYDIPGTNDHSYEMIQSDGGFIVMAGQLTQPRELVLFKIDHNGSVVWAKTYLFSNLTSTQTHAGSSQLIQTGNQLWFTGWGVGGSGTTDLFVMRTDHNGEVDIPCVHGQDITIPVIGVPNPSFYNITMTEFDVTLNENILSPLLVMTETLPSCFITDTFTSLVQATICHGNSYEGYAAPGTYEDYFMTNDGCDSLRTLELKVDTLTPTSEVVKICMGETYAGYSVSGNYMDTFQTSQGCDSVRILQLTIEDFIFQNVSATICEGSNYLGYSAAGTYRDTFQTNDGCDSVRILQLMIENTTFQNVDLTICEGSNYLGYSTTGIYRDTFQTNKGCDSIRILDLAVSSVIYTDEVIQICLGDSYQGHSISGVYRDTLQASGGCDSVVTLQLSVMPVEMMLDVEICSGGHFENYSTQGIYVDTLKGISIPCDTVRQINLSVLPMVETTESKTICAGENYFGYQATGIYADTLVSPEGCHSKRTVVLTVKDQISAHSTASVCEGTHSYKKAGTYIDTLVSFDGCDSIRTLVVEGVSKYIPNVFSPNQDGINDLFEVVQFPDAMFELQYFGIFDRYGTMAYETTRWPIIWDGNGKNEVPYNPGVFTYVMVYYCGEEKITETGDITLLR